jgi:hypothetical protein
MYIYIHMIQIHIMLWDNVVVLPMFKNLHLRNGFCKVIQQLAETWLAPDLDMSWAIGDARHGPYT